MCTVVILKFHKSLFLVILLHFICICDSTTVTSKHGIIKGLRAVDGNYTMYLGIPYAKINESNPFGESLPYPQFDSEFEAFDDSGICVQREEFNSTIVGNLDCLHVNIYVPDLLDKTKKIPVLAYIFGGKFKIGFAGRFLYGPKYLVEHGIILVILNYRLGPYASFCLSIPEVSGNQGLKDQIKALRWIKENIEAFGGDSTKITIDGSSSGAIIVDYMVHGLRDEKLFDKIIFQSFTLGLEILEPDDSLPVKLANKLGYNASNLEDALHYLTITDPSLVINASLSLDLKYSACLEKKLDGEQMIVDYPITLQLPMLKDMPILIGNADREPIYLFDNMTDKDLMNLDIFINQFYLEVNDTVYMEEMKNIGNQFYFKKDPSRFKNETVNYVTDLNFFHPAKRMMKRYLENGANKMYYYLFTYDGGRNFVKRRSNTLLPGASHADEIGYLFDMSIWKDSISPNDSLMIKYMTTLWTNFVKYGNPTPEVTDLLPVQWLPYNLNTQYYMDINLKLNLKAGLNSRSMAFWDLFYDINGKFRKGRNNHIYEN